MLQSITWKTYFEIIGFASIAYYAAIALLFYRQDILLKIQRSLSPKQTTETGSKENQHREYTNDQYYEKDFTESNHTSVLAEAFHAELRAFTESTGDGYTKPQLIAGLKMLLKKYIVLKDETYQTPINSAIAEECRNYCTISLTDEEICALWND